MNCDCDCDCYNYCHCHCHCYYYYYYYYYFLYSTSLSFFLSFLFFFTSNSILNYFNKRLQLIWLTLANRATESRLFPFSPFLHLLRSKFRLVLSPSSSSLYLQEWLLFRSGYYIVYFVIYIRIKTGQSLCF